MALSLEQKKAVVAEVAEVASSAHSLVGAQYIGITVEDMTALRAKARAESVYLRVVKNTLARRAIVGTEFECVSAALTGPLVLAFSQVDPGAAARVIQSFAKANDKLVVKVVSIGGKLLEAGDVTRLASMPTKDQAISMLMSVIKAPVTKLAGTLVAPHTKLVRTVVAVCEQKKAG